MQIFVFLFLPLGGSNNPTQGKKSSSQTWLKENESLYWSSTTTEEHQKGKKKNVGGGQETNGDTSEPESYYKTPHTAGLQCEGIYNNQSHHSFEVSHVCTLSQPPPIDVPINVVDDWTRACSDKTLKFEKRGDVVRYEGGLDVRLGGIVSR